MSVLGVPVSPTVVNFSGGVLNDVESIVFTNQLPLFPSSTAIFSNLQFDGVQIRDNVQLVGSNGFNTIQVIGGSIDASKWSFSNWTFGADTILFQGGGGNDTMTGSLAGDRILGNGGNDSLRGGGGTNFLSGGTGDDTIISDPNNSGDSIDGGGGTDLLVLVRTGSPEAIGFTLTAAAGGDIGDGTKVSGIERLQFFGGSGADDVTGGALDDFLAGGTGDDDLDGGAGNDVLKGGAGEDELASYSATGQDVLDGDEDNDLALIFREASNLDFTISLLLPGTQDIGDGTIIEEFEALLFAGGTGNDAITGGNLLDRISGGDGNDTLASNGASSELSGGTGDDRINAGPGTLGAILDGDDGTDLLIIDRVSSLISHTINITLSDGATGDDAQYEGFEVLHATGGSDSDRLTGGELDDRLDGGGGNDTLVGNGGRDDLRGGAGTNFLSGLGGNDRIYSTGADHIDGGSGVDFLQLARFLSTADLFVSIAAGGEGSDIGDGTTVLGTEKIEFLGGSGSDNVTGGSRADSLFGGGGNDNLNGGGGVDSLNGGSGRNTLIAGGGGDLILAADVDSSDADIIDGGAGTDRLVFDGSAALFAIAINLTLGGGGANIGNGTKISNIESIDFEGGAQSDTVTGGAFDDSMRGGAGNDTMAGGDGRDFLNYSGTPLAGVTVSLAVTGPQNTGAAGIDTISGFEDVLGTKFADNLTGSSASNELSGDFGDDRLSGLGSSDSLFGDDGGDILNGGGGADVLFGEDGADRMAGGAGDDVFRYTQASQSSTELGVDRITDFQQNADVIDLTVIDANGEFLAGDAFTFIGESKFTNVAGQLRFTQVDSKNVTVVSADTSGDGIADLVIEAVGLIAFTEGDFAL